MLSQFQQQNFISGNETQKSQPLLSRQRQAAGEHHRENSGDIQVICRPGCGHHPHSLEIHTPIIEFTEAHPQKPVGQ